MHRLLGKDGRVCAACGDVKDGHGTGHAPPFAGRDDYHGLRGAGTGTWGSGTAVAAPVCLLTISRGGLRRRRSARQLLLGLGLHRACVVLVEAVFGRLLERPDALAERVPEFRELLRAKQEHEYKEDDE